MNNITRKIPQLYTLKEAAEMLRISIGTLYNLNWQKKLKCVKIAGRLKMTEEAILEMIVKGELNYDN